MKDIVLSKQQIFDLLKIYEHFKTYDSFEVTLSNDGMISIKLDSKKIKHKIDKTFVPTL